MGLTAKPNDVSKYRQSQLTKGRKSRKVTVSQELAMGKAASSQAADKGMPRKGAMKWWKDAAKRALSRTKAGKSKTKKDEALKAAQGKK